MTGRDDPNWGWEFRVEDFVYARLCDDQNAAEHLPASADREAALNRVAALREALAEHSIYVTPPDTPEQAESRAFRESLGIHTQAAGTSAGRCYTCPSISGVPCATVMALARIWIGHPDFPHDYQRNRSRGDRQVVEAGTFRRLHWPHTITASGGHP